MASLKVRLGGLRAKHALIRANLPRARREAVREGVKVFVGDLVRLSQPHRDTNRYVRAWIEAGQKTGATNLPMPPVVQSRYLSLHLDAYQAYIDRLEAQAEDARQTLERWYIRKGRRDDRTSQRLKNTIEKKSRQAQLKREEMKQVAQATGAIIIDAGRIYKGGQSARHKGGHQPDRLVTGPQNKPSARFKVYGGDGRIYQGATVSYVLLKNAEPHARIVEWKFGLVRQAKAGLNLYGLRKVRTAGVATMLTGVRGARVR